MTDDAFFCFNPLHCGAVVASRSRPPTDCAPCGVSIPFIAGQWSLLGVILMMAVITHCVSIPFIAGQWSLQGGSVEAIVYIF